MTIRAAGIGEWLARTAMLVLAALATLALVGSLAGVSNSSIGDAFPGEIAVPETQVPVVAGAAAPPSAPRVTTPDGATMTIEATASPQPQPADTQVARWLKALTYAVLALTAVAAAGVVALARIGNRLGRP